MPSLRSRALAALIVALPVSARVSPAQSAAAKPAAAKPADAAPAAGDSARPAAPAADPLERIVWRSGPTTAALGGVAQLNVPDACRVTDAAGAALFTEGGPEAARGDELGVVLCASARPDGGHWYAVLRYDTTGRVSDADRDSLDSDVILAGLRRESTADTEARRKRGEPALPLVGWAQPPTYDKSRFTMSWATIYANGNAADETVVHSVRLLGREGVMRADLVVSPTEYPAELPAFEALVRGLSFADGKHYADWQEGEPEAGYGLAALPGGATITVGEAGALVAIWLALKVLVTKGSLLMKKIILAGLAALGVGLRAWWKRRRAATA